MLIRGGDDTWTAKKRQKNPAEAGEPWAGRNIDLLGKPSKRLSENVFMLYYQMFMRAENSYIQPSRIHISKKFSTKGIETMDYSEEERQMLLVASMKKLIAILNELENSFDCEINRRFNLDRDMYEGFTRGFSDGDGFARVVAEQTEKHTQTETLLKRCESYIKPGVEPKCYEIMMVTFKRRLAKIGVALDYLNTLIQMAKETNSTFVDFVYAVRKEAREIALGNTLEMSSHFDLGIIMQRL